MGAANIAELSGGLSGDGGRVATVPLSYEISDVSDEAIASGDLPRWPGPIELVPFRSC